MELLDYATLIQPTTLDKGFWNANYIDVLWHHH